MTLRESIGDMNALVDMMSADMRRNDRCGGDMMVDGTSRYNGVVGGGRDGLENRASNFPRVGVGVVVAPTTTTPAQRNNATAPSFVF